MSSSDARKAGALPPQDLTRLAQRDIGKVARLFRDSGFRYRVFDSETGEHQIVDPVRPLPPMDHVPPVWPPPLSEEELAPRVVAPRPAAVAVSAVAPAPLPEPVVVPEPVAPAAPASVVPVVPVPEPKTSPAALRAEAKTDEIFRAAALGQAPEARSAPAPRPARGEEARMSPSRNQPAPAAPAAAAPTTARQVGRLVAIAGAQEARAAKATEPVAAPAAAAQRPFRGGGPSVAAVLGKLMQPPPPPPRPAPATTAAVLRGLVAARPPRR